MKWFITGGAGFIGCNTAKRLIAEGHDVIIFDNFSRRGSKINLEWLKTYGKYSFIEGDIRSYCALKEALSQHGTIDAIVHLAAQVAVTTSVQDPREDFEINAMGTFNLLESIRELKLNPVIINASTNKVYGALERFPVKEEKKKYSFVHLPKGVDESIGLDFHSPYGCSKGCADQYMVDYSRIYGMKTVNFRQSCIYGYRQFGIEDQGWVAWFIIAALTGKPVTIYGNGKQVRDILFVDDLVNAYMLAVKNIKTVCGRTYNIGGGIENSISLLEFVEKIETFLGKKISYSFDDWRPGDQPIFISDITKVMTDLNWRPEKSVDAGVELLFKWVKDNIHLFK